MAVRGLRGSARHRAVLLDALGTLVELQPPAPRLRHELRQRFGLSVSEAEAQRAMESEMVYYRTHLNEGRDPASLARLRRRCAEVLWEGLPPGARGERPGLEELTEALMSSLSFRAYPDTPGALATLKEIGVTLIVVSNWDVSLLDILGRVGLAGHLDGVLTSAEIGVRKPQRTIFDRALALAGASPGESIHVGDSLREDVEGARGAGIEAVLVVRSESVQSAGSGGHGGPRAARQIASLSELPGLVRNIAEET